MSNALSVNPCAPAPSPTEALACDRRALIAGLGALGGMAVSAMLTRRAAAGPLDPPLGPVTSSYKTLTEVEPRIAINHTNTPGGGGSVYRIAQPGSYYLPGNITGQASRMTLEIAASNVSIDLMGFAVQGVPGSQLAISAFAAVNNVVIRNGFITGPGDGIVLTVVATGDGGLIENVHAWNVGGVGIVPNANSIVRNCSAMDCMGVGIGVPDNCIVEECVVRSCNSRAITAGSSCIVHNCAAYQNGFEGVFVGNRSRVTDCICYGNGGGITVATGSLVRGNFCSNHTIAAGNAAGVLCTGSDNRVEENNCCAGNRGIRATAGGNIIIRNTCSGNTTNWEISSGNAVAPIVLATTNGAAISGNSYAGSLGSTDPNANFTY